MTRTIADITGHTLLDSKIESQRTVLTLFFIDVVDINRGSETYLTSINQRSIKDQCRARICILMFISPSKLYPENLL